MTPLLPLTVHDMTLLSVVAIIEVSAGMLYLAWHEWRVATARARALRKARASIEAVRRRHAFRSAAPLPGRMPPPPLATPITYATPWLIVPGALKAPKTKRPTTHKEA